MKYKQLTLVLCLTILMGACPSPKKSRPETTPPEPLGIIKAKIIRAGVDQNEPYLLEKDEFLKLMDQATSDEADQIELILFGNDTENNKNDWMQAFRTAFFKGYDLLKLGITPLNTKELRMIWDYTSEALKKNTFEFIPGSSLKDSANQDLFTDKMVVPSGFLSLCLGNNQNDPKIEGIKVIRLPKPSATKDGLKYMPGSALEGKQCIVYVPKKWFGAGSQHKGFYPHDYSVSLNMLLELANEGDQEFMGMVHDSFINFKDLAENIGHIPNANKSWSIGYTSRTQTNTLTSQVLLYAQYLKKTKGEEEAKKWIREVGLPIAKNNLDFLTVPRMQTYEGLYLFIPIGKIPDDPQGDTYAYTAEMHNSPVLHNFYFERLLSDLMRAYENRMDKPNYCTAVDCLKYIEAVADPDITGQLKTRDLSQLIKDREKLVDISPEALKERQKFAQTMKGLVFVWDNPIRGEELIIKSPRTEKHYRLTNYALGSDQSMRASGFDPSDMAGLNSLDALDTAYVGHNAQLYRQMTDMAVIYKWLGENDKAGEMNDKASKLKQAILKNMWSEKFGELVTFHRVKGKNDYRFFDMSYSLWAHLFDVTNPIERDKLMSIVRNIADYEGPEGPYASTDWSGHNWGWGKVWPVMAAYAFMGLRDYSEILKENGYTKEAELCENTAQRIALKWLYSNAEMFAKEYGFGENLAVRPDGKPLENIYGYNVDPKKAGNYTWHVVITRWFYPQLTPKSKALFDTFYAALKAKHPDRL